VRRNNAEVVASWAGVDVGGTRKGFHVAVIDACGVVAGPLNAKSVSAAVDFLLELEPLVIGVDSPRSAAVPSSRSRPCERDLARTVCGIRYTPDARTIERGGPYYEWVRLGFELYEALLGTHKPWKVIEVFPTASLTRLHQARASSPRAAWSRAGLAKLDLTDVANRRLGQDDRDAIIAAFTARLSSESGRIEWFGEIAVPK
jgi:predicted nuclease with RNAse H fold